MKNHVALGALAEIPQGEGRTFVVGGERVAVFHTRTGKFYATAALCPHRRGPLADGLLGAKQIVCPLHEWTFDLETGAPLVGECGVKIYRVRDDAGQLVLEWDEVAENALPLGAAE